MKQYFFLMLILLSHLILVGCSSNQHAILNPGLTQESWIREVDVDTNKWTRGADSWFLHGYPATPQPNQHDNFLPAMSSMNVSVQNFSKIKVSGNFLVQIFGTSGPSSVNVYGPNDAVRATLVSVNGGILCLNQVKKAPNNMGRVVVRVGVNNLDTLISLGGAKIEGVQLSSRSLSVISSGGSVYLSGSMNLTSLVNDGGLVSIFGANTPQLDVKVSGKSCTNICGNVGIRSIMHHGKADLNIVGANSNDLTIYADGSGKVGVNGMVNLREIKARGTVHVNVYKIMSPELHAYVYDGARIGLAGYVNNLYLDAYGRSCVGGRDLCVDMGYIRAHHSSHVNISSNNKIFAASTENSSVYFFGSPNVMTQFVSGNGIVLPIWSYRTNNCPVVQQPVVPVSYKGEAPSFKGERATVFPYKRHKRLKGEG